jgi:hypothetical protein
MTHDEALGLDDILCFVLEAFMPPPFKARGLAHDAACTRRLDLVVTMHTIAALECVCKAWPGIVEPFWLDLHKRITGLAPTSTGKRDLRLCCLAAKVTRENTTRITDLGLFGMPYSYSSDDEHNYGHNSDDDRAADAAQGNDCGGMKPILAWSMARCLHNKTWLVRPTAYTGRNDPMRGAWEALIAAGDVFEMHIPLLQEPRKKNYDRHNQGKYMPFEIHQQEAFKEFALVLSNFEHNYDFYAERGVPLFAMFKERCAPSRLTEMFTELGNGADRECRCGFSFVVGTDTLKLRFDFTDHEWTSWEFEMQIIFFDGNEMYPAPSQQQKTRYAQQQMLRELMGVATTSGSSSSEEDEEDAVSDDEEREQKATAICSGWEVAMENAKRGHTELSERIRRAAEEKQAARDAALSPGMRGLLAALAKLPPPAADY